MIKVENENVEVRGIALDVIGEFQALCDHLNKELGEKDFAFVLGTIAGKFYKKRIAELEDDLNNASQVCAICQKEQENDRLKAELEAECQEHQEAMRVADNTIKVLEKALELACANHPATCNVDANCNNEVDCVECLVEHYKAQAIKDLCGVKNE